MNESEGRLPLKTKIGFALGDVYGGGSGVVIGMFYLYFLTDIVRLPASSAGALLLISKIWDAVIDPAPGLPHRPHDDAMGAEAPPTSSSGCPSSSYPSPSFGCRRASNPRRPNSPSPSAATSWRRRSPRP